MNLLWFAIVCREPLSGKAEHLSKSCLVMKKAPGLGAAGSRGKDAFQGRRGMAELPGSRRMMANGKKRGKKGGENKVDETGRFMEESYGWRSRKRRKKRKRGKEEKKERKKIGASFQKSSFLTTLPACERRSLITPPLPAGADLGILPEKSSGHPELPAGFRRILRISQLKGISHVRI